MNVEQLRAQEILDSRGYPTVEVSITLQGAPPISARASVPSGKSTGQFEALERRDHDPKRYTGKGVLDAVRAVEETIAPALVGAPLPEQEALDQALIALDGTPTKSNLGANAILGVSLAAARARALAGGQALFESLAAPDANLLPVPCLNVINGGAHSDTPLEFQEFMIVPAGRPTFAE
ncbi:MAG TPA: phosphopyruvate hydratase, partial [Deinococcales bacterium]|nr:phosphopyruvate hydratase [Deinococcales bacterium]